MKKVLLFVLSLFTNMIKSWKNYNKYLIEEINKSFFGLTVELEDAVKGNATKKDDW